MKLLAFKNLPESRFQELLNTIGQGIEAPPNCPDLPWVQEFGLESSEPDAPEPPVFFDLAELTGG